MFTVPALTPFTVPDTEPTPATAVLLLVQLPPYVAELKVVDDPVQTVDDPVIAAGDRLTVMVVVAWQPAPNE